MRDVSEDDISWLLKFMYNGEVRIPQERLKDFMRTAETLQIRGLADEELPEPSSDHPAAAADHQSSSQQVKNSFVSTNYYTST